MADLKVFLLGPPRVERDGRPVELRLRRAVALLVYLAQTGRPQGRDVLASLLWPEADDREARARLRRTLHRVAEVLGAGVVVVDGDCLRIAAGADDWVDARAFEREAATGLDPGDPAPGPEHMERLRRAAGLYADDFLAGFALKDSAAWEEWQFHERERLRQTAAGVLEQLVAAHRAQQTWAAAIPYARRRLALDPLHEPAHRALMELYARTGQHAAAQRQYQECARLLEAELGAPPEPATVELFEAIRARRLTPRTSALPAVNPAGESADDRHVDSLPLLPGPLVGRQRDLARCHQALLSDGVRLLTLTGPPGVGKTSLALALAHGLHGRFANPVRLIDLAPIADPREVGRAIAESLKVPATGQRPIERLARFLRTQDHLLVLDNFEQVVEAASLVADLLAACPRLRVVVTSRGPLRVRWERELLLDPLELPDRHGLSPAELAEVPAVRLFADRARAVSRDFELSADNADDVAAICVRLDGLPLAIELAAARVRTLPLEAILVQLAGDAGGRTGVLELLMDGPRDLPPRQQTLRDAIRWSYTLLGPAEQAVFRRLAVFAGGCTFEAAATVCDAALEAISTLVEQSLLRREHRGRGEPRFRMLEPIRLFALEQLTASGEIEGLRARHATFFVDLAGQAEPELDGSQPQAWLARLELDRDNLWAVERWAAGRGDAETVVRLGAALWPFWLARGDAAEARDRLDAILPLARRVAPTPALARALHGAGLLAEVLGEYATCRSLLEEGVAVARRLDDRRTLAGLLDSLGRQHFVEGRYAESRVLLDESLAILRALDDRRGVARGLSHVGFLDYLEGHQTSARARFSEGLTLARCEGDRHQVAEFLDNLGNTFFAEGDLDSAARMFEDAVAIWREVGQGHWLAMALNNLGSVLTLHGELAPARVLLREALSLARKMGNRRWQVFVLRAVATLAAAEEQAERALCFDAAASAAAEAIGAVLERPTYVRRAPSIARARQLVGEQGAAVAATAGRAMPLEQAAEAALAWLGEPHPTVTAHATARQPRSSPPPTTTDETLAVADVALWERVSVELSGNA
jgi:predicted ATPase/DNA-binding SARP family transcriptional activator/Tfp pilus assembly protein PilF